jgi:hypothetical protein
MLESAGPGAVNPERNGPPRSWLRDHPDLVVIAAWWLLEIAFASVRKDFMGDGLRHLPAILRGTHPPLGEPRWLFFPGLLFVLLRPFVSLGLVTTVEGLTHPFIAISLLLGLIYMLAARACLSALAIRPARRAAGLALAGTVTSMLMVVPDLKEPIFAATLAMVGLAYAARRAHAPETSPRTQARAVLVAVACIAVAGLIYQGVVFGIGLVPIVVPRAAWWNRRTLFAAAAIVVAVPLVAVLVLMLDGNGPAHAFERFARGEENPYYRTWLRRPGVEQFLVALLAGPPQAIVGVSDDFHGLRSALAALHDPALRGAALRVFAPLALGGALIAAGLLAALRRRDATLLAGFAILLVLQLLRRQQPGYIKYYALFPMLVAVAGARAPIAITAPLAGLLLLLNGVPFAQSLREQRVRYADRVTAYAQADARSCWLSTGWIPSVSFRWPGEVCPILGNLAGGHGADAAEVVSNAHAALAQCLRACFCASSGVYTDDMTETGVPAITQTSREFAYTDMDLTTLVIPTARAQLITDASPPAIYRYPPAEQQRLCAVVTASLPVQPNAR